jgi:hypothetical protein
MCKIFKFFPKIGMLHPRHFFPEPEDLVAAEEEEGSMVHGGLSSVLK